MPKRAQGLSARGVQTEKAPGMYADGNGLYLQVTPGGAKSWIFRYSMAGRRREMGLGPLALVSLAEARDKALELRKAVFIGTDPLEARKVNTAAAIASAVHAITFRECCASYIDVMKAGWSNAKHADQWTSSLASYAYPVIGDVTVSLIDTPMVLKVLEPIWTEKTETASRVRGRIESVLDWAKVRGYRDGENPARWKGHLELILPAKGDVAPVEHHAALLYADLPAFWRKLAEQDGTGARALELCILTATRSGEVLGARWSEIDLEAQVWTVPADRMKAGAEHRIPLAEASIVLLKKLRALGTSEFVFEGQTKGKPISNMTMNATLKRMKVDVTPHGFRSTFRTWAAEKTRFQHEVCEAALAHTQGDRVVAAYQRGDMFEKRRELMAAWADFAEGRTEGAVAPMARRS